VESSLNFEVDLLEHRQSCSQSAQPGLRRRRMREGGSGE
jgi:hypothetical protein